MVTRKRWISFRIAALLGSMTCGLAQEPVARLSIVRGTPFSALAVTKTTRALADGNRIVHQTSATIARDSEGRTRREQKVDGNDASIVFILDPVAGAAYVLDARDLSARKILTPKSAVAESTAASSTDTESLGTQVIEGFVSEGTRLKRTITAESAASERPLQVTLEAWYSTRLQVVIKHKTVDPRLGEVDYSLTNIQLAEPAASLFEVPREYTIREEPQIVRPLMIERLKEK